MTQIVSTARLILIPVSYGESRNVLPQLMSPVKKKDMKASLLFNIFRNKDTCFTSN